MLADYERTVEAGELVFMDVDDLADIADYYQQQGRYDDAQRVLERVQELDPDSIVALDYMTHQAINEGDFESAEQYLDRMDDHDAPEYTYCRAEIWIAQQQVDKADDYLRRSLKEVPAEEYQDFVLDTVNLYTDYGYNEKAMEWMMRARQENTDDFKELMARTLFGLGKYDDSERIFNELIDRHPFQKRYWNALASTQFMKEDYNAAVSSSEYAIAIDPGDAEGLLAKANGLYQLENYEEALDYYRRYSEKMPDDEFGLLHQGCCLINLARNEEALEVLQRAVDTAPDDSPYLAEIYQEIAFAYSEQGQPESALYYIDQTEAAGYNAADAEVLRGHILLSHDRLQEAESAFQQAVQLSTDREQTVVRIIVSIYDNHYVETAYKMFQNFFSNIAGDDCRVGYAYMALCCYDLQKSDEFLSYLKEACERNPHEARTVLGHLFPADVKAADYYQYMIDKMKQ